MVAINVIIPIGSTLWHNPPNTTTIIFVIIYILSPNLVTVIWLSCIILDSSRIEGYFIHKTKYYIYLSATTVWSLSLFFPGFWNHYIYLKKLYNNIGRLKRSMMFCNKFRLIKFENWPPCASQTSLNWISWYYRQRTKFISVVNSVSALEFYSSVELRFW